MSKSRLIDELHRLVSTIRLDVQPDSDSDSDSDPDPDPDPDPALQWKVTASLDPAWPEVISSGGEQ
jgi:hypothetical protein